MISGLGDVWFIYVASLCGDTKSDSIYFTDAFKLFLLQWKAILNISLTVLNLYFPIKEIMNDSLFYNAISQNTPSHVNTFISTHPIFERYDTQRQ